MSEPLPFRLNDTNMLRLIRQIAADSGSVYFAAHAMKRMKERRITRSQVMACLRNGTIDEPAHTNIKGNLQCTLRHRHAGDLVKAAVAVEKEESGNWIVVITVF